MRIAISIEIKSALSLDPHFFTASSATSAPFCGGYFALARQFIEQLPILPIDFAVAAERARHDAIVSLVERILAAKQANPTADTSALEREIDQQVYILEGLTPEEIAIVEGTAK